MKVPKSQISFIVSRMHVSTTSTQIVKEFYRRFKLSKDKKFTKKFRKACYKAAIHAHFGNARIFNDYKF